MAYYLYDHLTPDARREPVAYGHDYHALLDMLRRQDAGRIVDDFGLTEAHKANGVTMTWDDAEHVWKGDAV